MTKTISSAAFSWLALAMLLLPGRTFGQSPGYIVSLSGGPYTTLSGIFYVPPAGQTYRLLASPSVLPQGSWEGQLLASLPGNRQLLVNERYGALTTTNYFLFDLDQLTYSPLASVPPIPPLTLAFPGETVVDQEGDVIYVAGQQVAGVYRLGSDLRFHRFAPLPGSSNGILVDIDTGDYIVSDYSWLLRVRPSGTVSTMATLGMANVQGQDPETGEFLTWILGAAPSRLHKITASGTITSTSVEADYPAATAVDDVPSAWGEYAYCGRYYLARASRYGGPRTILTGFPGSAVWGMELERTRNVSTANAGAPNRWHVFVDFPRDAGSPYVVLLGASGIRPGIPLPDQRKIRLNPDGLTWLGLAGALPGVTGLSGVLDSRGTARGLVDFSAAPARLRGVPFWMVGIAIDPGPPPAIRSVSPPVVVQIR